MAVFYGAAAISGAFSGLLAAAIAKMDDLGNYEAWRWIFIIEGLLTVVVGLSCFFILPDSPSLSGRWLSEHEIRFLIRMHEKHRGARRQLVNDPEQKKQRFQWTVLLSVLTDWQIYLQSLIFLSSAVPNYALKFTMPQIILNSKQLRTIVNFQQTTSATRSLFKYLPRNALSSCSFQARLKADGTHFSNRSPSRGFNS